MRRNIRSIEISSWIWHSVFASALFPIAFFSFHCSPYGLLWDCRRFSCFLIKTFGLTNVWEETFFFKNRPSIGPWVSPLWERLYAAAQQFPLGLSNVPHTALLSQWQKQQQPVAWQADWTLAGEPSIRHGRLLSACVCETCWMLF